jgi:hypothetical protein
MMDPFILLAPILLLAVVALLGFVGCFIKPSPPTPAITSLDPPSKAAGESGFLLTVYGSNLFHYSVVRWNGSDRKTDFVSGNHLTATITADDIATEGTATVTVSNEDSTSNPWIFTINPLETVTFDPPPPLNPGDMLPAGYHNLDFTNAWVWQDPANTMGPANCVIIITNGPNPSSGDISFHNGPRRLVKIRVYPKRATTVTISDGTNPNVNLPVSKNFQLADANMVQFIDTGWTVQTPTFTIVTDIGYDLLVDTIVYEGPP